MNVSLNETDLNLINNLLFIDPDIETIFNKALHINEEYIIKISAEDLDFFLDSLAAEINHESDKSRQANLESVFDKLEKELENNK